VNYTIKIADNAGFFGDITEIENIPNLFLDLAVGGGNMVSFEPIEFNTRYFWRVRGVSADDSNGEWSETFTFVVIDIPAPLKTTFRHPEYAEVLTKNYTIEFEAALFATYHIVEVSTDASFRSPIVQEEVALPTTSLDVVLAYGETYYIRVQGIGRGGFGEYSEDLKITVEPIPSP
jgi:hypothetical protein